MIEKTQKIWRVWGWPVIIICSAITAELVTFIPPGLAVRPLPVMWFLFVCPGMMLVRFFRIQEVIMEWTLALALSISIDAIVASIVLYAGKWSPPTILNILVGSCLVGAVVQFASTRFTLPRLPTKKRSSVRSRREKPRPTRLNSLRRLLHKG